MLQSVRPSISILLVFGLLLVGCSTTEGEDEPEVTTAALPEVPDSVPLTPELAGDCVVLREVFGKATMDASNANDQPPPIEVGDVPNEAQLAVVQAGADSLGTIEFESEHVAGAVEALLASSEAVLQRGADGDSITQADLDANVQANLSLGRLCSQVLEGPASTSVSPSTTIDQ